MVFVDRGPSRRWQVFWGSAFCLSDLISPPAKAARRTELLRDSLFNFAPPTVGYQLAVSGGMEWVFQAENDLLLPS